MAAYEFHPLADEFPLMEGKEFDDLVADIEAHGQREKIVLYDGKILDGRNRYRACVKLDIEPDTVQFVRTQPDAFTYDMARNYVISANAHRRHLAPGEKYKIIEALLRNNPGYVGPGDCREGMHQSQECGACPQADG